MTSTRDWLDALVATTRGGRTAVLVTVASVKGSAPREPGARMLVADDAVTGTIGGGQLEYKAIAIARDVLASGSAGDLRRFPLAASLGQCCGGVATLFFDPVAAGARWVDALAVRYRAGVACVVATPSRGAAQERRLVVDAGAIEGSLGAEERDARASAIARRMLASGAPTGLASVGDDDECLFDVVRPPALHIVLFGAGHVGRALVRTLAGCDGRIVWVDTRDDAFPATVPPNVECVGTDAPETEVAAAPAGAHFLVMTHSHPLDQALTEVILQRDDFAWFGLIGSVSKRRQFERRLRLLGVDPRRFVRMTCPIGIAGISSKEPAAIAIAVAAQVLQSRERAQRAAVPATGAPAARTGEQRWKRS